MCERRGTKGLELWCRKMTEGYSGVKIDNMTTSWRDGLAFCAIIHHFRPDLIDFSKLNKDDIYHNNELAFRVAEQYLGIPALLEPEDMVEYTVPDRLSILTYLSQFYQAFGVSGSGATKIPAKRPQTATDHGIVSPASTSPPTKITAYTGIGRLRRETCAKCALPVFIAERLNVGKLLYHRTCFRCARCDSQLTLANCYETENNEFCCEVCPDEEKSRPTSEQDKCMRLNLDVEKSVLSRSMSDEEKSALIQTKYVVDDPYSSQFERDLEKDNNTSNSAFSGARNLFLDSQLNDFDSGTCGVEKSNADNDSGFPTASVHIVSDSLEDKLVKDVVTKEDSHDIPIEDDKKLMTPDKPDSIIITEFVSDKVNDKNDSIVSSDGSVVFVSETKLSLNDSVEFVAEYETSNDKSPDIEIIKDEPETQIKEELETTSKEEEKVEQPIVQEDIEEKPEITEKNLDNTVEIEEVVEDKPVPLVEEVEDKNDVVPALPEPIKQDDVNSVPVVPKPRKKKKVKKQESYPEDLNPFGDDDLPGDQSASTVEDPKPQNTSLNPFGDEEDEEEPVEIKKKVIKPERITLNPFWTDGEEEEEEILKKPVPSPRSSVRTLEPKSRYESGTSTPTSSSHAGSVNSLVDPGQSTLRKKKPAPKPPTIIKDDASNSSITSSPTPSTAPSPRMTPKNRKAKRAPPPPGTSTPCEPKKDNTVSFSVSAVPHEPADDLDLEKTQKDDMNRNRQSQNLSLHRTSSSENSSTYSTPNKSTYGQWKRRKGPAPQRPIPQRRTIKALPMGEIKRELEIIEIQQQGLEKQGVMIEQMIRERSENNTNPDEILPIEVEDLILQLFELVNEKNELFRKQTELMYLRRQQRLEEEHADVEYQIRCLMLQPDSTKEESDKAREEELINRLVKIVERRNEIIEILEMDRLREAQEDDSINSQMNLYMMKRGDEEKVEKTTIVDKHKEKKEKKKHKSAKEKIKEKLHILKDKDKKKKPDMDKDVDESETPSASTLGRDKDKKKKSAFKY